MDARLSAAVAAGRLAGVLSRTLGLGGGTTLPGEVAARVDPRALAKLASGLARGSVVVTGTNGKTTTARLIASVLTAAGWRPVHNRAGANLLSGVGSSLVGRSRLDGRPAADAGLFEVDEAVLPEAVARLAPRAVVVTNLFRDQLDRYGEVDYLAGVWRRAVAGLPASATLVVNADDPLVASLAADTAARTLRFGVEDLRWSRCASGHSSSAGLEHAADSTACVVCGAALAYAAAYYAHVGVYRCPRCGWARPTPEVAARRVEPAGVDGAALTLATPSGELSLRLGLPGLYNVYNALAAVAACLALGVEPAAVRVGIERFVAAFGRIERVRVGDRTAFLALVKNPVGFNQVIQTLFVDPRADPRSAGPGRADPAAEPAAAPDGPAAGAASEAELRNALILINDHFADGTDVSWLWDVDFERLTGRVGFVVAGGTRGEDMLVRLKYAGVAVERLHLAKEPAAALRLALERTPAGGTLYVLPTYTAMLEVRGVLSDWGYVERFWEN